MYDGWPLVNVRICRDPGFGLSHTTANDWSRITRRRTANPAFQLPTPPASAMASPA